MPRGLFSNRSRGQTETPSWVTLLAHLRFASKKRGWACANAHVGTHWAMPVRTRARAADHEEFKRRLRYCINKVGTQIGLANAAGIPQSTLRGYLLRGAEPQRDALVKIAEAAAVSLGWLAAAIGTRDLHEKNEPSAPEFASQGETKVIDAAAALAGVPADIARRRLVGSTELRDFMVAVADCAAHVTIQEVSSKRPVLTIQRAELEKIIPPASRPNNIECMRVAAACAEPRLGAGDWALIDTAAPIKSGPYCVINHGGDPEIVRLTVMTGEEVEMRPTAGNIEIIRPWHLPMEELRMKFPIAGRVVAGLAAYQVGPRIE